MVNGAIWGNSSFGFWCAGQSLGTTKERDFRPPDYGVGGACICALAARGAMELGDCHRACDQFDVSDQNYASAGRR